MKHLYLCGPMSGLPDSNYPAFHRAAAELRAAGYQVTNPAENGLGPDAPWLAHMRVDIKALMDCDAIAALGGWSKSHGATIEFDLALELGIDVGAYEFWLAKACAKTLAESCEVHEP